MAHPRRSPERSPTLSRTTSHCCNDPLNLSNTCRWPSPPNSSTPGSPARSAPSATPWTTPCASRPSGCSRPKRSTWPARPGPTAETSNGKSPAGSTGTTPTGSTPRSGTCPRLSSNNITGRLEPRPPTGRSRNPHTLRRTQGGSDQDIGPDTDTSQSSGNWVARHDLVLYFVLAYVLSWAVWPLVLANPESSPLVPFG